MPEVFKSTEWVLHNYECGVWVSLITTADNNILIQSNDNGDNCDLIPENGIYCKDEARSAWKGLTENGWEFIKNNK